MRDLPFTNWMSKVKLDMNKLLKSIIIIILIQTLAMVVKSALSESLSIGDVRLSAKQRGYREAKLPRGAACA